MATNHLPIRILAVSLTLGLQAQLFGQIAPPPPPIPFEKDNATFAGTITIGAPIILTNTNNQFNTNGISFPPETKIAPVTFSGTVNDVDNITQSYSRRTKLWTLAYNGGSSAVTSAAILSNLVLGIYNFNPLDTNIAGWTFGAELMNNGDLMPLRLYKINANNVVLRSESQSAINMNFYMPESARTGTVSYDQNGFVVAMNAISRDKVNVNVMPEAYTWPGDPDGVNFNLTGISSNTLTQRTNLIVMPGFPPMTNFHIWTSISGTVPISGNGN